MSQEAVHHTTSLEYECPASLVPLLCDLAVAHSIKISLISHAGNLENISLPAGPTGLLETAQLKDYSVLMESDYVWVIVDDCGECFNPEVDQKIKAAYRQGHSNGMLFAGFSHNGIQYTIDFTSLRISQPNSSVTRLLQQIPPFWYRVAPETVLIDREHSAIIEEVYCYGGSQVAMGGTQWTFFFSPDESYQIDLATFRKIPIARHPPVTSTPSNPCELRVNIVLQGECASVLAVVSQLNQLCQSCYSYRFSFPFPVDGSSQHIALHQVANITRRYCVSAQHELTDNHISVTLQGADIYVESVASLLCDMIATEWQKYVAPYTAELQQYATLLDAELQQHITSLNAKVQQYVTNLGVPNESWPSGWKPHARGEDYQLVPVQEGSQEWQEVLEDMKQTLPQVEIVGLDRVQNWPLWQKYTLEKKQMSKRNVGEVNEKSLFHGSRKTKPKDIAFSLRGVDFRYSKKGMWGAGAYFAVNASYSDQTYAHKPNSKDRQLILVQVLTGKSYPYKGETNPDLIMPPELPAAKNDGERYDTVNGETGGSTVYVVYDHDRSYPAYIITYRPS